jgi:flagellar hook protein FlgE
MQAANVVSPISVAREAFDPSDPATYTYGNTKTLYDGLGEEHTLGYYYIKQGESNTYEMVVTVDGKTQYEDPITGDMTSYIPDDVVVTFDTAGNISGVAQGFPPFAVTQPITLEIKGFDPTNRSTSIPFDMNGSTQFALNSSDVFLQDGFTAGELQGVSFDEDGFLIATYTNQQTSVLGQIALATFDNTDGLTPSGDTSWVASSNSGQANVGKPNTGTLGSVKGGALEESNVDLTSELVALIEAQRNYQANSKTLETENTVTQTIINLR